MPDPALLNRLVTQAEARMVAAEAARDAAEERVTALAWRCSQLEHALARLLNALPSGQAGARAEARRLLAEEMPDKAPFTPPPGIIKAIP